MNAGDMAFFYHSNCKTPGIVGTMEIVREFSEDSEDGVAIPRMWPYAETDPVPCRERPSPRHAVL
jgi:predicted RNA-binding protein with PUA-like domain